MGSQRELPQKGDAILFLDVESLPGSKENPLWLKLSSELARKEDHTDEQHAERVEKLYRDNALHAGLGVAWMIGFAIGSNDPRIIRSNGSPESEKELLEEFHEGVVEVCTVQQNGRDVFRTPWWIGHNIEGYDIPFLQVRALHHGLPGLSKMLSPIKSQKPWERRILDTQKLWPRTGADRYAHRDGGLKGFLKLDTICRILGIEHQEGVMGNSVYDAFLAGDHEGVAKHLDADVRQVREVFKKLWPAL